MLGGVPVDSVVRFSFEEESRGGIHLVGVKGNGHAVTFSMSSRASHRSIIKLWTKRNLQLKRYFDLHEILKTAVCTI